ncbi:ArsR/SmtB family transcription factor [Streptomyces coeruleorubidus]|uniref:ArsR/SmtB family transcription factor n=1 Tax=Streptomyces coeruleorubidus TaxID=116188 RepID=UPI00379280C0
MRQSACSVTELTTTVGMEQSAASHQLRLLRALGLVAGQRDGRRIVYRLYDDHVAQLLDQAVHHIEHLRLGVRDFVASDRSDPREQLWLSGSTSSDTCVNCHMPMWPRTACGGGSLRQRRARGAPQDQHHGDHIDYAHDGHLHKAHAGHVDECASADHTTH